MVKFTNTIAQITSILLHPLLMPVFGLLIIYTSGTYISLLPYEAKRIILIVVAINTLVLPLLMIPLFYRLGFIKSLQMHLHKERIFPIAFTLIPYIFSFYFLKRLPIPGIISTFMLGATITVGISLIITFWWKISLHMIGIGGIVGFIFAFSLRLHTDVLYFILIAVVAAGLLAWSRLQLNEHKPSQVYCGFLTGGLIMFLTLLLL